MRRRLTPPGGARDLLPAEYAYTLPARRAREPRPGTLPLPRPARAPRRSGRHAAARRAFTTAVSDGHALRRGPAATSATTPARRSSASARETPFALDEVDIEADDALHARYLERIPVVALDGEELFDYFVDEATLAARLCRNARVDRA